MHREPIFQRKFAFSGALLGLLMLCSFLISMPAKAQATEYQVKAVFLFRFAEFVEWPPNEFASPQSPIIIGVLGSNPFGNALPQAVQGEKTKGRSFVVKQFRTVQEIGSCQILFISRSEAEQLSRTLAALNGRSILTVSDIEGFASQNGMIEFKTEERRVSFTINRIPVESAGLKLSSKLLRLSQ